MDSPDATLDARDCPTDDELASYLDHAAPPALRARIEAHVDRCETCREAVGMVTSAAAPAGPRTIDRYRLDEKLGAGGMGVVWKAWDPALERPIAIKLLHPDHDDRDGRERALREARALARLHHPNVLAIYDVGEHDGDVFIATELIDGEPMDRWQRGKTPAQIVAAYAQAARGLAAAHAIGLVHRDVKPSNILVAKSGRVAVGDFGLATSAARSSVQYAPRTRDAGPLPKLTADGAVLGTPAYMAPEQHDRAEVDARADQYSLCLALAEALLGKMPALDQLRTPLGSAERRGNAATCEATAQTLAASGIDAPWTAIARGLAERPQERFPKIEDLVLELEPRPHRVPARGVAIGAAMLAVGGLVTWQLTRAPQETVTARPAPSPVTPPPVVAPTSWYWVGGATGPWQLPESTLSLGIADDDHAVALGISGFSVIDLTSGKVTTVTYPEHEPSNVDAIARLGSRLIAFGDDGSGVPAAWDVSTSPPRLTPVVLSDINPVVVNESFSTGAIVSPDGKFVVVCSRQRPAIVRDTTTLAIVQALPGLACEQAHFSDARHLAMFDVDGDSSYDVTTAVRTSVKSREVSKFAGAGSWSVTSSPRITEVSHGAQSIRVDTKRRLLDEVHWSPDLTYLVALFGEDLTIYPLEDPEADEVTVNLSSLRAQIAVTSSRVIAINDRSVVTVDLSSGRVHKPERNLSRVTDIAPWGSAVLVSSDEIRVWRDGKVAGRTSEAQAFAVGPAGSPVALLTNDALELWNPDTDERTRLRSMKWIFGGVLARDGDAIVVSDAERLLRGDIATTLRPWHTLKPDIEVRAIDVRGERLALTASDATHLVDLRARSVWSFYVAAGDSCQAARDVRFATDPNVFGIDNTDVYVGNSRTRTLRQFGSDEPWWQWTFLPTGELVVATTTKLLLVDPTQGTAVGWTSPIQEQPRAIGVDPRGTAIAVGFDGGGVIWLDVAGLRAHAQATPIEVKTASLCAPPPPPRSYESLVAD